MYDDEYETCKLTYASFCLYGDDLDPGEVSVVLGLRPTRANRKGDVPKVKGPPSAPYRVGSWILCTEASVISRDLRRHIDWLLDALEGKDEALRFLQDRGYTNRFFCLWLSAYGHGGPILSPPQLKRLGELNIALELDCHYS